MGGLPAARMNDEFGHVGLLARLARVGLRVAAMAVEGLVVAGAIAAVVVGGAYVAAAAGVTAAAAVTFGGVFGFMSCGVGMVISGFVAGFIGRVTGYTEKRDKFINELTEDIGELEVTGKLGIRGAATVFINDVPAMRAVLDAGLCRKHPNAASPPPNRIAEGSDSVFIETGPAARKGDKLQCAAQIKDGSPDVFVGGNRTAYLNIADDKDLWEYFAEAALGLAMGRGSMGSRLACLGMGVVGGVLGDIAGRLYNWVAGRPVNPQTGGKILDGSLDTDFFLPSPGGMDVVWQRFYSSHDHRETTMFGKGWSVPYEVELVVEVPEGFDPAAPSADARITFINNQGRCIVFPWIAPGRAIYDRETGYSVGHLANGGFIAWHLDRIQLNFPSLPIAEKPEQAQDEIQYPPGSHRLRLQGLSNPFGQWIRIKYDALERIVRITDKLGRVIDFMYSQAERRVLEVRLTQGAPGEQGGLLAKYGYDKDGQLVGVTDRMGRVVRRFSYADGLMTMHADAAGLESYYEWEAPHAASGPDSESLAKGSRFATPTGKDRRVIRNWTNGNEDYSLRYVAPTLDQGSNDLLEPGRTIATDQLGRTRTWMWDTRFNLVAFEDELKHRWKLEWNEYREIVRAVRPDGAAFEYHYDENGMRTGVLDPAGRYFRTVWDSNWSVPRIIYGPDGSAWHLEYDAKGLVASVSSPDKSRTEYVHDSLGQLVELVDAKGGRKQLRYESRGLLKEYVDCSAKSTRYTYDGAGYLSSTINAKGFTTSLAHSLSGELLSVALPDGGRTDYRYDDAGRLVSTSDAHSRQTYLGYTLSSQVSWRIDEEQRQVSCTYDAADRIQKLTNENGESFEFIYDAANRLIEERRVGGTRVCVEYDLNGLPTAITRHPGLGDEIATADALSQGQTPEIQGWGDAVSAGSAEGSGAIRTELVRDILGRLIEKRTAQHHYRYRYDLDGRLVSATKFKVNGSAPDSDGNLSFELTALHTNCFAYDKAGMLVREDAIDEVTGKQHSLAHQHDALGNRTQTILPATDAQAGPVSIERALNYLYYGSGHLHQINYSHRALPVDPADAQETLATHQLICDIERDDLHQEILRSQGAMHTRYAHDAVGRMTGAWSQSNSLVTQPIEPGSAGAAAWSEALAHLQQASANAPSAPGLLKAWQYDKVGELRASRHSLRGDTGHRYDATSRILQTSHALLAGVRQPFAQAANESFGYDPAGNIQDGATQQAVRSSTALSQRGYVRDNLVRVFEDKRYFYDGHGRLIRKLAGKHTAQTFSWDDENHLTEVVTTRRPGTEHETTQATRFDYDAIGRRVAKHDSFGTTTFIWEGMRLIEERRGGAIISYVYEPGSYVPLARLDADGEKTEQGGLGTTEDADLETAKTIAASASQTSAGGPNHSKPAANDAESRYWASLNAAAQERAQTLQVEDWGNGTTGQATGTTGQTELCKVYYFHTDQVGMPQELSNSWGQLVWQASYKTWGSTVAEEWEIKSLSGNAVHQLDRGDSPQAEDERQQNLRFQGQYLDRETGLHYNTFRYFDADIGRFICPDPIGLQGGINLGSYAPNPTEWADPSGLENRENNGKYHIYHDHSVNPNNRYSSDSVQFNRANQELATRMKNDPQFRREMISKDPRMADWYKKPGSSSPPGFTWHHHEDVNRLVLVDRGDHSSNISYTIPQE